VDQINSNAGNAQERSRESVSILLYSTSLFPASLVETYRIHDNIICMEKETTVNRNAAKRAEVANLKEFEKQCIAFPFGGTSLALISDAILNQPPERLLNILESRVNQ
jgi:hypothetical protein